MGVHPLLDEERFDVHGASRPEGGTTSHILHRGTASGNREADADADDAR